ncbi:ABC transporter substrate-binding protein [Campylobacter canadensis]|uniref:ABC transporter substrate-binding protein n=1 Tax=Campylobacter canadensis TaxID=449520 RepID=UPI001CC9D96D|nr:ABC transporter substrate-binding protein [Campylobacter canadensis]MBZ7996024.1 ABC transporter substrate-binding protein [Campylobacter canadensis]MBZ7999660.1 ABC transporter substrate-binding protein [Campylobacter canadensis]MBZ8001455.1 ABC transporter substrate-binding protein [Campylobacter canadensis]MBZ8003970.1 ABC transporter substrate-binding protein [Campylobacter canadensis]
MEKIILLFTLFFLFSCSNKNEKEVDFMLDYTINTNHIGLFVALEKGYFKENNIKLNILSALEDSTSDMVIHKKVQFGIYFQESLAAKLAKGANISAVAAIIKHNTSGILSTKDINSIDKMQGKKYGSWNDPVEQAMIKEIFKENLIKDVNFVPNQDSNSISSLKNNIFDFCWVYYAWDGVLAKTLKLEYNFFYLKDYIKELDYYSPIIIANNDWLKENKELAKKVLQAIKKGYIFAMKNPQESAKILIKYTPNLAKNKEFILNSLIYLSKQFADKPEEWGFIDANRWNEFYSWLNKKEILKNKIPLNVGFTNEYLK